MSEVLKLAGLAKRAGRLAIGEDMTQEAIQGHKARLILLAADAAEGTARRIRSRAGDRIPVLTVPEDRTALGAALGRETCAVCCLTDLGLASRAADALAAERAEYAEAAAGLRRKQEKLLRRKKEKPRKK